MELLDRLFRRKDSKRPSLSERDNVGIRQSTLDQAVAYWNTRNMRQKFDPFVLYVFEKEAAARNALLELDCVHEAKDSGRLICTEALVFGYYRTEAGKYEAIIAGEDLSHQLWQAAKDSFERHGGRRKNDQEPEEQAGSKIQKAQRVTSDVEFVRKYTERGNTYETYECADVELTIEFLSTKSVETERYYVVVETPMGNWGVDVKGLYKERLLPWQTDAASAEVEGVASGMADSFALEMAARGYNDNFVVGVQCGNCGHHWVEGLRYQNWTVVQCPSCQKRNRINSQNYTAIFV